MCFVFSCRTIMLMQNDGKNGPVVITPGQVPQPAPTPQPQVGQPVPQKQVPTQPSPEPPAEPNEVEAIEADDVPGVVDGNFVEWSASEFLDHNKGIGWYLGLTFVIVVISGLVYVLVKSIFTSIMILLIGVAFGIAGARKPRTLEYGVNSQGIKIGDKFHPYTDFKSFSITSEGAIKVLVLTPFKRLSTPLSLYYEEKDEDRIMTIVSNNLPHEEHVKDPVEQFMRKVKF